ESTINKAFEERAGISAQSKGAIADAVKETLTLLDCGTLRVAEKQGGEWMVRQWVKKAILLSFRLNPMSLIEGGPGGAAWWDKVPSKFAGWTPGDFDKAG